MVGVGVLLGGIICLEALGRLHVRVLVSLALGNGCLGKRVNLFFFF